MAGLHPQYISTAVCSACLTFALSCPSHLRAYAPLSVSISLSLSHGFTTKSNAPRFMPSTASEMSAYAVKSTTSVSGFDFFISESQNRPSLPVFADETKFMSSSTTSGAKSLSSALITFGVEASRTSLKYFVSRSFSVALMPLLSSTTSIFPLFINVPELKFFVF